MLAGPDALAELPAALAQSGFAGTLFVVADEKALELHGARLRAHLSDAPLLAISGDEANKTVAQVSAVWDWLVESKAQRRMRCSPFGGGGWRPAIAASRRGANQLANAPTTCRNKWTRQSAENRRQPSARQELTGAFTSRRVVADTSLLARRRARSRAAWLKWPRWR